MIQPSKARSTSHTARRGLQGGSSVPSPLRRTPLKPGTKPLSRSTPIQRKPLKPAAKKVDIASKRDRYSFVVCPACDYFDDNCPICKNSRQVKVVHKRFAPKSGPPRAIKALKPEDKDWSYQVRERDNWTCRWCGKQHQTWLGEDGLIRCQTLDATHLFSRGKHGTRTDIRNGFAGCKFTCHKLHMRSEDPAFHEWAKTELTTMYGEGTYEELEQLSKPKKIVKRRLPIDP